MITLSAGYFRSAIEDPDAIIARARKNLADVLLLRKPNDGTHGDERGEGTIGNRWIFVDDFVETGATKKRVLATVRSIIAAESWRFEYSGAPAPPVYVGDYLYRDAEVLGDGWQPA